ncbi:hypothetical protein [Kineosporia sp. NBRC 101731]|uniref:hypothetical protein n=1 Tax=Kineosporia sp. NBRC 101731 TaxID=3032199 RepID=UPI0024A3F6F7|nr:hypothetical protein [Kineosporia sp. NBRC 101731]GLY31893.1 hypothetical protein Kisp02_52580 [Kineosporia sp. NBRC 101731]
MTSDERVTISGGTFTTQGAMAVGAHSRATANVTESGQELPEVLAADEIRLLQGHLADLRGRLEALDDQDTEAAQLQIGTVEQALAAPAPKRRTVLTILTGAATMTEQLTGIGEFVKRLVNLVSTGVF